jgi:hypothetical protein
MRQLTHLPASLMSKRYYKHKLLLDENMPDRSYFPQLNQHFDVKHVKLDLRKEGLPDPPVYALAVSLGCILVTFNWSDFVPLVGRRRDCGLIGVSGMDWHRIDTKLTALLVRQGPGYFRGKVRTLGAEEARKQAA